MEKMTYHCAVERKDRIANIAKTIGIGQIIREKYIHTQEQIMRGQAGKYVCITDTGVTIIKTEDKLKIITMYVTTFRELVMVFNGTRDIPTFLKKKVDKNQSKYTVNGKTIWK